MNQRILIVKMSSLGDIIHVFPILHFLKQAMPGCEIDWVVEEPFAELVRAHHLVHKVITVRTRHWRSHLLERKTWKEIKDFRKELRKEEYDLVLDLQGNSKSALATAFARCSRKVGFGFSTVPEWPNLLTTHSRYNPPKGKNIREDYLYLAKNGLEYLNGKFVDLPEISQPLSANDMPLKLSESDNRQLQNMLGQLKLLSGIKVMVCAGSNWKNKQLSEESLRSFLRCFVERLDAHVILVWGNEVEKALAEKLAVEWPGHSMVAARLSLPCLQNLMGCVDLVVAMDSLPLHLAGTTPTPTYSVFGSSSARKYQPLGECRRSFQGSCPYGKTFEKRCAILRTCETGACIRQLKGEDLFADFYAWWSNA